MVTTTTTSNNSNVSLAVREFDLGNPPDIYRKLNNILKESLISERNYWYTHDIISRDGQVQLAYYPGNRERRAQIVHYTGNNNLILPIVREALYSPLLPFEEKVELISNARQHFKVSNIDFTDEPKLILSLIDARGDQSSFELTLSQFSNSFLLTKFWNGNYSESIRAQTGSEIPIILPEGTTLADFFNYVNSDRLELLTSDELSAVLFLSNYFQDINTGNRCLDLLPYSLPPSRTVLEDLLIQNPIFISEIRNRYASIIMNQYIQLRLKEGSSIQDIVQTIQRVPELKEAIHNISFDLHLTDLVSSSSDLTLLASAIPNVRSLNLSNSNIDSLPLVWGDTLQLLDISNTKNITTIPAGFTHLEEFFANDSKIQDISGLNGSTTLKEIYIYETPVTSAPHDCSALEIFFAPFATQLTDISGLDRSPVLKEIYLGHTPVTTAPNNCDALQVFNVENASQLNNISGLNDSLSLRELHIGGTLVTSAPHNCPALEIFYARFAKQLSDISGLNDSLSLRELHIGGTLVTSAPHNCPALEIFEARFAKQLSDISELSGLEFLQEIDIGSTLVTSAPYNCPALEIFYAKFAQNLNDISGLRGSPDLQTINVQLTAITKIPEGVFARKILKKE